MSQAHRLLATRADRLAVFSASLAAQHARLLQVPLQLMLKSPRHATPPFQLPIDHHAMPELAHPCRLVLVDVVAISSVEHHAPLWGRRVRPDLMAAFAWPAHKAQRTQFRSRIPQLHKLPPRTSSRSRNACSKSAISLR